MSVREVQSYVTALYDFTIDLLVMMRVYLPFLGDWEPDEINNAKIAIGYSVHPSGMFSLKSRKPEDEINIGPYVGINTIWATDGNSALEKLNLLNGEFYYKDIIPDGTKFFITRELQSDGAYRFIVYGSFSVSYPIITEITPTDHNAVAKMLARECGYEVP